jgi:hypothetical protein
MVNLLVAVLLSGLAVTFTIEFIYLFVGLLISKERLYSVLSLPLSFGALYCYYPLETSFVVSVPAISFIVLFINKYINKPIVLPSRR